MGYLKIDDRTLVSKTSFRGGGIEITLDGLKNNTYDGGKMTAYQNYLGGGMLGAIGNDCNVSDWRNDKFLVEVAVQLSQHLHELTNHSDDEWESATFEENQLRPTSAL